MPPESVYPAAGLRERVGVRVLNWRDRWLASPRFQRWAAAFPLTRPIARRRTRELFDLCAGFVYSQVLYACVRLHLFEQLAAGPQTGAALAGQLGLSPAATVRLLDAAVALRLVELRSQNRYGLGVLGAALAGNPGISAMIEHHALLYADLGDPLALLRGERQDTALARYWPYAGSAQPAELTAERVTAYTALMAASQSFISNEILAAYPFDRHRCLLDVGGGDGSFLVAAAARAPQLRLGLFDLPPVAAQARAHLARVGLSARATVVGGSVLSDPLPAGADLVTLVRVIHDHDDAAALAILRAVRRVLPADGVLLLAEPMADTAGAEPAGAYFGFYLLAMGSGRPRSVPELTALLHAAGFATVRRLPTRTPLLVQVLQAHGVAKK